MISSWVFRLLGRLDGRSTSPGHTVAETFVRPSHHFGFRRGIGRGQPAVERIEFQLCFVVGRAR